MTQYLSILAWAFVPNFATSWMQSIYYSLTIRAGDPKPRPGSAKFNSDRRIIHMLIVATYLLYTIYEADWELRKRPSYYTDLGVSIDAVEKEIKTRFRRLAALHHPDKAGSEAAAKAAEYFIHLKRAADTLQDAAMRFAYERFGPDVANWQKCKSVRDYITKGVLSGILPHYGMAAATIYVLGLLGYMDFGKYYRWLILLTLCTFEIHAVTRPEFPAFLTGINTFLTTLTSRAPYLPYQLIILARKLTITTYIGLSQLGPVLAAHLGWNTSSSDDDDKVLHQGLDRLEALSKQIDTETTRLVDMEVAPYKGDTEATKSLQGKMKEWLVQNTIRADPMVRDALGNSFRRRRVNTPTGTRGTT